jgi:hypothetical protein
MPLRGVKERSMWLAVAVLRGVEKREGALSRKNAVEALTKLLGYSERQARHLLRLLVEEQYLVLVTNGLRITGFRTTAKSIALLEKLYLA